MNEEKNSLKASGRAMRFRLNLLIFPQFQLRLIAANLTVMVVVCGVMWYQMSSAVSDLSVVGALSGIEKAQYERFLAYQDHNLQLSLIISMVLGMGLSAFLTLLLSHKFSGPLIRLRGYFRSISAGTDPIPKLSFRRGDFLGDIPPIVNDAISKIESRSERAKESSTRAA